MDSSSPLVPDPVGLLVINLGTPDQPQTTEVRRYLREFLSDPRVIDVSPLLRKFLVECIILPRRPRESAKAYQKIWTDRGSPLLFHGLDLVGKLDQRTEPHIQVELAMRYQSPSIASALDRMRDQGVQRVIVFPLFPQYSSAAFGSAVEKVYAEAGQRWNVPNLSIVPPYYAHPSFIACLAGVARPELDRFRSDKILMSYHGVPERQVRKGDDSGRHCLSSDDCCDQITSQNAWCYRAQCYATSRALAEALGLDEDAYQITFQSRLGRDPWIRPYTDLVLNALPASGVKRVAILSPAFTADCLETLEELQIRAKVDFIAAGGDDLMLVPSLNANDAWADAVLDIVRDALDVSLTRIVS